MSVKCARVIFLLLLAPFISVAQSPAPQFSQELAVAKTDSQRLQIYKRIHSTYKSSSNDSVRIYLEQGLNTFTNSHYEHGRATILAMLSSNYSDEGHPLKADNAANEALAIYTKLNDEEGLAKLHNTLGVIEGRKANYNAALKHFLQAMPYFERTHDTTNIINTCIKLGAAHNYSGNTEKALAYYRKGIAMSLLRKPSANIAHLYNNVGSVFAEKEQYDSALHYFNKAVEASSNKEFIQASISPLMNIGNIYAEKGDHKKALEYYHKTLELAKQTGVRDQYAKALYSIGSIESSDEPGNTKSLQDALFVSYETDNKNLRLDILTALANAAGASKDYKTQVVYLKNAKALNDSIFNLEKSIEIANLQSKYELDKTNTQLAALQKSEERNLQKKNFIIVIALILAATLITTLFFFFKSLKLNLALSKREQDLQKANTTKDRLFSIIGHDLKGPIGNIPVLLDIYKSPDTPAEEKAFILDSLEENSIASLETLEKLLSWGKLQIKGNTLHQSVFEVAGIMENKLKLLRVTANNKNITIVNKIPEHTKLYADENHFKFIMRNLLSNAVKYTRTSGTIEINAEQAKDDYIIFSVKDNGIGIDEDKQEHIFEPYNESTVGTANELGNSIGLMLCKEFTLQNGGNIWVKSEKGEGATFYFSLMAEEHQSN